MSGDGITLNSIKASVTPTAKEKKNDLAVQMSKV